MPFQSNFTNDVPAVEQIPGGHRRVLGDGERMMLVEWRMQPGTVVPEHSHPHEQCGYVISGKMLFTIEGQEREVPLGTGYLIPPNVPHRARFKEFTVLVDIFSPPREDYRELSASAPSYMLGTMQTAKGERAMAKSSVKRNRAKLVNNLKTNKTKSTTLKKTMAKIEQPKTPKRPAKRKSW